MSVPVLISAVLALVVVGGILTGGLVASLCEDSLRWMRDRR